MKDFEKELANAYGEVLDIEIDEVIAESEKEAHVFSQSFENRMEELIRTGKPGSKKALSKRGKRILIIAIAAVLALIATACAVPEIRESIAGFFVKIFSDHVEYTDPAITKERIEEEYGLVPVPEGFAELFCNDDGSSCMTTYENSAGQDILLIQSAGESQSHSVDNENGDFLEREVDGVKVVVYSSEDTTQASWIKDGYYFSLSCPASIDSEEIIELIKTISVKVQ